jgi:predicted nucleic acid-binding protein
MIRDIIVADASCLIVLQNIGELTLLQKLFHEISITEEVSSEFGLPLPEWVKVRSVINTAKKDSLGLVLDSGEASSIALCLESENPLLIIDEKKGRRIAQDLGIKTVGTVGLIIKAKKDGSIDSPENLVTLLESHGFYISQNLKKLISEDEEVYSAPQN